MRRPLFRSAPPGGVGTLGTGALAAMVDLLTILLVVLLRTWSTEPPLDLAEPGAELPLSQAEDPVGPGVIVDIGPSGLWVEGERTGAVSYHLDSDEVLVQELYSALQQRGGRRVVVRADQDTPWRLLGKVMFTAQHAGYAEIEVVAVSTSSL